MNPIRVMPPDGALVPLADLKEYLRVSDDDTDAQIMQLEQAAVAHLDGWRGVLRRCILLQTWEVRLGPGKHRLPFPDVITVEGGDWDGQFVTLAEAGAVQFTCALPEDALPAIQDAVKIWVQMRYDGLSGPDRAAHQAAFNSLIGPIRWTRV